MNKKCILALTIIIHTFSYAGAFEDILHTVSPAGAQRALFLGVREEKKQQLENLEQELQTLQKQTPEFKERITSRLEEIAQAQIEVKEALRLQPDDDVIVKKFALLNEELQTLKDIERTREQEIATINEFIKNITAYLDDSDYITFKKEHKIVDVLYYSFNDLLSTHEAILKIEQRVKQLTEQAQHAQNEQKSRERITTALVEENKKKTEQAKNNAQETSDHNAEIQVLEQNSYQSKKELSELRLLDGKYRIELLAFQLFVSKNHLAILKDHLRRIKSSLRIGEADVTQSKEDLKKLQQDYFKQKEMYRQHLEELETQQKGQESAFEVAAKQYNMASGEDLDDWSRKPKQTIQSYVGLTKLGLINSSLLLLKHSKELIEAHVALEDERFAYQSLQIRIKEIYYKVRSRRFTSEEQITQETKQYETTKSNVQGALALYKEKMDQVARLLNEQKHIVDNIHALRKDIEEKRYTLFKNNQQEYSLCLDLLRRSERKIRDTIEVLGKLTGVYASVTNELNASLRIINFIVSEAQSIITIWYRPSYAISWRGFTNVLNDTTVFISELGSYFTRFDITSFVMRIYDSLGQTNVLIILLLKLLTLLILFILAYKYALRLSALFIHYAKKSKGFVALFCYGISFAFHFIRLHIGMVFFVMCMYMIITAHIIPDPYLYVILYLTAIPCLIFLMNRCIKSFMLFNSEHGYPIISIDWQDRFVLVFSFFIYTSIFLLLFRQAFLQINYYHPELYRSELPNILVAINFIVLQLSLMLLITKEQVLSILPQQNAFMVWIYNQVDRYYYVLFLLALIVIVMSHPYVGFSRLVIYLVFGLFYSVVLIKILLMAHEFLKNIAKKIFFEERDQVIRERFVNAKTWFGISIICSFLFFLFFGMLIGAKIWGWPITIQSAIDWLYEPILFKASSTPLTAYSLLEIVVFIVGGFIASYALDHFVLDKIFDLLLVDSGVQHMVTSILRYIIIATAVFLGLYSVNLGGLVTWLIAALGLSIGWVLKDPMADIIAYFIILVQRPIKIGDYIKINENVMGIVRRITPRSVVLRRRNSTTFVIPNSTIISQSIENWNYARNFIAFDDIFVTIHYKEDPALVKELLMQVVHEHPQILRNPKAIVRLHAIEERGYVFMVRGYLSSAYTLDQWDIASDVRIAIVKRLKENNMRLALPLLQLSTHEIEELAFLKEEQKKHKMRD